MTILRINEPEAGGGGEDHAVFEGAEVESTTGPVIESSAATPVVAQPSPQLTVDAIAEAMKRVGVGTQVASSEPTKQYTQEDFDKAFQVFNPSTELVNQIVAGGDGAVQAMTKLRDGLVRQAVTMASYIVQDQIEKYEAKFRPQFEPVAKYVTEKQVKELYDDFYDANKDLKPYDSVVQAAVQQLKAEGASFKTKEEGFKSAADRTRAILKTIPGISLDSTSGSQSPNSSRMPTLSKGGQGGLGKGPSGGSGAKDPSHAVFG